MSSALPPEAFFEIFGFLNTKGFIPIVVAGQAVNIWAQHFEGWDEKFSPRGIQLGSLHPFNSDDMEVLSGSLKALRKHPDVLTVDANQPFGHLWSPDEATIHLESQEHGNLKIQSMKAIKGVQREEIEKSLIPVSKEGVFFLIPDPITLLKAKLANVQEMDQADRNDVKHVKMLLRCVRAFIGEDVQNGVEGRHVLKSISRLDKIARSSSAQWASKTHGLEVRDAVPLDIMAGSNDAKIRRFVEQGYKTFAGLEPLQKKAVMDLSETAALKGLKSPPKFGRSQYLELIKGGVVNAAENLKKHALPLRGGFNSKGKK